MEQWSTTTVPLVIENRGSATWSPGTFNIAYHWSAPDGERVAFDGERTPLPREVPPGDEVEIEATLMAPRVSGQMRLQWDVVEEGVTWISEKDPTPSPLIPVSITPGVLTHAFTVLELDAPRLMWTRQRRDLDVRLRNDGTQTWKPDDTFNFSYHWNHPDGEKKEFEGTRTAVPKIVRQGGTVELSADILAPGEAGLYTLELDMVEENVLWFSQRDPTPPAGIRVLVLPNPFHGAPGSFFVSLLLLSLVLYALYKPGAPEWIVSLASIADLLWLWSALVLKQSSVLEEAQRLPLEGSFPVIASGVALIAMLVAVIPRMARPWIAIAVNVILSVLLLADVLYLRFFGGVLSLSVLGAVGQTGQVRESIISLLSIQDAWLFFDLLPGVAIALLVGRRSQLRSRRAIAWLLAVLTLLLIPGVIEWWRISNRSEGKFVQVFQNVFIVQEIGPLNYHVFDGLTAIRSALSTRPLSKERLAEIEAWFVATAPRRAGTGEWFGAGRGMNLLMLQVESMQSFVIGLEIDGQQITPTLDRWRNSPSVWQSSCIDQTVQGRTSDGEFITQTSLLPLSSGAVAFRYGENRYQAIGDIMAAHGYNTLSAVPFEGAFWNRLVTHPEYGYRTNLFADDFDAGIKVGWGLNDRDFLAQMARRLASTPGPFAAYLITLSNHHPYTAFPDELKELDLGDLEDTSLGNYLHSVHFFDAALAMFLDELQSQGLLEETVVVVWGDHTAGFPWDEQLSRMTGLAPTEKNFYIADRVPLFIHVPGADLPASDSLCGQVDVAPTVLPLMGIDASSYPFLGRNLFGHPAGPLVRRYDSWLSDDFLYVGKGVEIEEGRCYDIDTMTRVPSSRCKSAHDESIFQRSIARDIITHDLQETLVERLQKR